MLKDGVIRTGPVVSVKSSMLLFRQPVKTGQAGKKAVTMLKIAIIFITIAVFAVVNPEFLKPKKIVSNSALINFTEPQPVLAVESPVVSDPALLIIPSLSISAPFETIGLKADRSIEVPKNNMSVGWFVHGAKPGEAGVTVIVGHLDSAQGKAVFADLSRIQIGENIVIYRQDGSRVVYEVDSMSKYSQENFPTKTVYGATSFPAIRLITCSGSYNKKTGRYSENLVVFGSIK